MRTPKMGEALKKNYAQHSNPPPPIGPGFSVLVLTAWLIIVRIFRVFESH